MVGEGEGVWRIWKKGRLTEGEKREERAKGVDGEEDPVYEIGELGPSFRGQWGSGDETN